MLVWQMLTLEHNGLLIRHPSLNFIWVIGAVLCNWHIRYTSARAISAPVTHVLLLEEKTRRLAVRSFIKLTILHYTRSWLEELRGFRVALLMGRCVKAATSRVTTLRIKVEH
jgi:hypothetical protein